MTAAYRQFSPRRWAARLGERAGMSLEARRLPETAHDRHCYLLSSRAVAHELDGRARIERHRIDVAFRGPSWLRIAIAHDRRVAARRDDVRLSRTFPSSRLT